MNEEAKTNRLDYNNPTTRAERGQNLGKKTAELACRAGLIAIKTKADHNQMPAIERVMNDTSLYKTVENEITQAVSMATHPLDNRPAVARTAASAVVAVLKNRLHEEKVDISDGTEKAAWGAIEPAILAADTEGFSTNTAGTSR
jgi:predicted PhzF superfamily epimerase YddE/YHI9